jgi:hypothetical protein
MQEENLCERERDTGREMPNGSSTLEGSRKGWGLG